MPTFFIETLGCPKNSVDSDKLVGTLEADGMQPAATAADADLVVVNTCAFIEAARQESIETVLALSDARRPGARLVVTGCMAERYGDELAAALPEVDQVGRFGRCGLRGGPAGGGSSPVEWQSGTARSWPPPFRRSTRWPGSACRSPSAASRPSLTARAWTC